MANALSSFWNGIVADLNANKTSLGIGVHGNPDDPEDEGLPGAQRASTGKITTLTPPSIAVWILPQQAVQISQNGALSIKLEVYLYCIGAPGADEAASVDSAFDIALAAQNLLTNRIIEGTLLTQPDDAASISIVQSSSTESIVGVLFYAEVTL